jgi:hypothetical protein
MMGMGRGRKKQLLRDTLDRITNTTCKKGL